MKLEWPRVRDRCCTARPPKSKHCCNGRATPPDLQTATGSASVALGPVDNGAQNGCALQAHVATEPQLGGSSLFQRHLVVSDCDDNRVVAVVRGCARAGPADPSSLAMALPHGQCRDPAYEAANLSWSDSSRTTTAPAVKPAGSQVSHQLAQSQPSVPAKNTQFAFPPHRGLCDLTTRIFGSP
jgi:hypothetical protein